MEGADDCQGLLAVARACSQLCDRLATSQYASIPGQVDLLKIHRQEFNSSRFKIAKCPPHQPRAGL